MSAPGSLHSALRDRTGSTARVAAYSILRLAARITFAHFAMSA
jgi:hypothetical protein